MKRFILLVPFLVTCLFILAQGTQYTVYDVKNVALVPNNKALKANDKLNSKQKLKVIKGSFIKLLDTKTKKIYMEDKEGEYTVFSIIYNAEKKQNKRISEISGYVLEQVKKSNSSQQISYSAIGGAYRGTDVTDLNDSIYYTLRQEIKKLPTMNKNASGNVFLELIDVNTNQQLNKNKGTEFFYRITNNSDKVIFFNLLQLRKDTKPKVCFNIGYDYNTPYLVIDRNSVCNLNEFIFLYEKNNKFLLFWYPHAFDSKFLETQFDMNTKPKVNEGVQIGTFLD